MGKVRFLIGLGFLIFLSIAATAKTTSKTSYSYFKIVGQTAPQIYASLLVHAKAPGGHDAYATTSTRIFQKAKFSVGNACRVKNYDVMATFNIALPSLAPSSATGVVKSNWQSFATMLRRHEEHHRILWLACAENFNRRVLSLSAGNCSALNQKFTALWKATEATCRAQNDAFDKAEQGRFLKQSFIQLILHNK